MLKKKLSSRPKENLIAPRPTLPGTGAVAGIDVAKDKFDVCLLLTPDARPQRAVFTADAAGHEKFLRWLKASAGGESVLLCLEETGIYGRALATFLHEAGHHVSLVNAALIKHYGGSLNLRTKTDRVDAWLIARYAAERVPARWIPLAPQHQALRDTARRREQLMDLLLIEKNHLEASPSEAMSTHISEQITHLQTQIRALEQRMAEMVREDAALRRNAELLESIPRIGALTAHLLLAELPALDSFESARQLAAYAGLTPRHQQSGSSVQGKSRLCKQGRGVLRKILFMPAVGILGMKHGPLRQFADRLRGTGKTGMCVVGAVMRKLISLAFAILRSGKPFDPNFCRSQAAARS